MEFSGLDEQQVKRALLKLSEKYLLGEVEKDEYEQLKVKLESALTLVRLRESLRRGEISEEEYETMAGDLESRAGDVESVVYNLLAEEAAPSPPKEEPVPEAPAPETPQTVAKPEEPLEGRAPIEPSLPPEEEIVEEGAEVPNLLKPVQDMLRQLEDLEDKRARLKELFVKGEISDDTFVDLFLDLRRLKEELVSKLEEKKSELEDELMESKRAMRDLEKELEVLRAKVALGQITEIEYDVKREKIESELSRLKSDIETLQKALSIIEEGRVE